MATSSKPGSGRNVPPPAGARPASPYARFIPREELGDFASWQPGTFGGAVPGSHGSPGAPAAAGADAGAAEPVPATAEDWQARVAAARQTGYQEGYRDGLVALESFKQSFAQQATAQIGALLEAFDGQFDALDAEAARAVAQTAVKLARQVLRTELQLRPELVAQVAAEAVNAVMLSARHISVQVHPHDLPLVAEGAAEALAARACGVVSLAVAATRGMAVIMVRSSMCGGQRVGMPAAMPLHGSVVAASLLQPCRHESLFLRPALEQLAHRGHAGLVRQQRAAQLQHARFGRLQLAVLLAQGLVQALHEVAVAVQQFDRCRAAGPRGAALVIFAAVSVQLFGLQPQPVRSLFGVQQRGQRLVALAHGVFEQGVQCGGHRVRPRVRCPSGGAAWRGWRPARRVRACPAAAARSSSAAA